MPAGDDRGGDVPAVVVVSVALIIVATITGVTFLAYAGKNTTPLLSVLAVLSPFIIALLAVRNARKIDNVRRDVADVRGKVNGKIDNLITDKSNLEYQVSAAGLTPVTATISFDPETTNPNMQLITDPKTNPSMPKVHAGTPPVKGPATNPYSVAETLRRAQSEGSDNHG